MRGVRGARVRFIITNGFDLLFDLLNALVSNTSQKRGQKLCVCVCVCVCVCCVCVSVPEKCQRVMCVLDMQ